MLQKTSFERYLQLLCRVKVSLERRRSKEFEKMYGQHSMRSQRSRRSGVDLLLSFVQRIGNTKTVVIPQVHLLQPAVIVELHKKYVIDPACAVQLYKMWHKNTASSCHRKFHHIQEIKNSKVQIK